MVLPNLTLAEEFLYFGMHVTPIKIIILLVYPKKNKTINIFRLDHIPDMYHRVPDLGMRVPSIEKQDSIG